MAKDKLLNIAIFQVGWATCIFGGSFWAVVFTLCALVSHGLFFINNKREWAVIGLFSVFGILIDSTLIHFDILKSGATFIPLWLVCLWVLLSMTLCHSLKWLQKYLLLSAVAAALLAPWSYWVGSQFVNIELIPSVMNLLILAAAWALIIPMGLSLAKKLLSTHVDSAKSSKKISSPLLGLLVISSSSLGLFTYSPSSMANVVYPHDAKYGLIDVVGTAYDSQGEIILYKEIHRVQGESKRTVHYVSPKDKIVAKKQVDYTNSLISPAYTQENFWSNEQVRVNWIENELYLSFTNIAKAYDDEIAPSAQTKEKTISIENVVIDAGFDHYIRANWQALVSGKKLDYQFAVASQLTTITMRIQQDLCAKKLDSIDYSDVICFKTEPDSLLLRWLLAPIELSYRLSDQQLLRFRGLGNITDKEGDLLKVDIRYDYSLRSGPSANVDSEIAYGAGK
ncbi:MAG: hypothetical protein ACI9D5_001351 [Candidatus Endobugula sp.]|jgi:hypothetical protein